MAWGSGDIIFVGGKLYNNDNCKSNNNHSGGSGGEGMRSREKRGKRRPAILSFGEEDEAS